MNVSVVLTSFNQKAYLAKALDSLLTQTLSPGEILVCDDASTDGSREMIQAYADRYPDRVIPVFQETNLGVARNRNAGLARARGTYITTLDGDDLYAPEKLEKEVAVARATGAGLVYSNVAYLDSRGRMTGLRYTGRMAGGDLFETSATHLMPHPREILVRRDCLEAVGLQNASLPINEDFDWVLRLAGRYPFAPVNEVLVYHRIHDKGLSSGSRLLMLSTQRRVISNLMALVEAGEIRDRGKTLKRLTAFRNLTRAREFNQMGEKAKARRFLSRALAQDPLRSAAWDLWLRLTIFPGFRRPHRIADTLRLGPLAIPFYMVRGVMP